MGEYLSAPNLGALLQPTLATSREASLARPLSTLRKMQTWNVKRAEASSDIWSYQIRPLSRRIAKDQLTNDHLARKTSETQGSDHVRTAFPRRVHLIIYVHRGRVAPITSFLTRKEFAFGLTVDIRFEQGAPQDFCMPAWFLDCLYLTGVL